MDCRPLSAGKIFQGAARVRTASVARRRIAAVRIPGGRHLRAFRRRGPGRDGPDRSGGNGALPRAVRRGSRRGRLHFHRWPAGDHPHAGRRDHPRDRPAAGRPPGAGANPADAGAAQYDARGARERLAGPVDRPFPGGRHRELLCRRARHPL